MYKCLTVVECYNVGEIVVVDAVDFNPLPSRGVQDTYSEGKALLFVCIRTFDVNETGIDRLK